MLPLITLIACGGHIGNQTKSSSLDDIEADGHRLVETRVTATTPLVALVNATVLTATGARHSPG